jgi:SAM-dependent methyltransferase
MDYIEINKKLWDDKTDVHYKSDFYDVESFVKGKNSLNPIELDMLGDIKGKRILHLQCHFGMDSISLSRHGGIVTGVDLSEKAINKATELNEIVGANTRFIQSDIYSLHEKLKEQFDIVFTSYGVVGWLPDMDRWAETINKFLKPGGKFVMVEFHPVIWMFSYDFKKIEFNYSGPEPIVEELDGTYTDRDADLKNKSVSWNHGLANVIDSLIKKRLIISDFKEYNYSPYNCFEKTVEVENGKFQIRGLENKIPMLYSITADKK